ncbi:MAG: hypothetical protein IMY86_13980 [Chloroflexi bacterium]|nr:hypothetical protein [Chloroflexota bacterium]
MIITETTLGTVKKIVFDWTNDDAGRVIGWTTKVYSGRLIAVQSVPNAFTPPPNDYDILLYDADGMDLMHGLGFDINPGDVTAYWTEEDKLGAAMHSKLQFTTHDAGAGKKGVTVFWIR